MGNEKNPKTPAVRMLESLKIPFEGAPYRYEEKGGTRVSSRELGVDEHIVIKTLVMEDENKRPFIVLMHGDKEVSVKNMARTLGVKTVKPCTPEDVTKHTGYMVGGTSPFGTRKTLKIYIESTILQLPEIYINGGKRGFLVKISPNTVQKVLNAAGISVGI